MAAPTEIPAEFLPHVLEFLFDDNDVLMTIKYNLGNISLLLNGFDTVKLMMLLQNYQVPTE